MAITLTGSYSKKLGLPGFSSHSFAASVESELTDLGQVQGEVTRLYTLLQDAVDREIQHTGFVPDEAYGVGDGDEPESAPARNGAHNGNGSGNGSAYRNGNGNGTGSGPGWKCSDKQRDLIMRIIEENKLDKLEIDDLAKDRFGKGVKRLNKLEASGLIDELLESYSSNGQSNGNGNGRNRWNNGGDGRFAGSRKATRRSA